MDNVDTDDVTAAPVVALLYWMLGIYTFCSFVAQAYPRGNLFFFLLFSIVFSFFFEKCLSHNARADKSYLKFHGKVVMGR